MKQTEQNTIQTMGETINAKQYAYKNNRLWKETHMDHNSSRGLEAMIQLKNLNLLNVGLRIGYISYTSARQTSEGKLT